MGTNAIKLHVKSFRTVVGDIDSRSAPAPR